MQYILGESQLEKQPRIAVIARADLTGLGIQSRNWVRLLNPDKVVVINSTPFNHNEQHYEWYKDRNVYHINGFIDNTQIPQILNDVEVILTFEIPYNYLLFSSAKSSGVKTILQNNWEFTDYLQQPFLPKPDILVNHSYWHIDEQKHKWPDITEYCPTPIFIEDYDDIMLQNIDRYSVKRRFLHIAGRKTYEDRNGTKSLLEAVKLIPAEYDFELVIKTQTVDVGDFKDQRVTINSDSPVDEKELYRGFDAVIMPRRYGGACMPMTEALAAGLPVIMPDIDPNNKILPSDWLVPADKTGSFMARIEIAIYNTDIRALAQKIIQLVTESEDSMIARKIRAREIACNEYSSETVKEKWTLLLAKLGL